MPSRFLTSRLAPHREPQRRQPTASPFFAMACRAVALTLATFLLTASPVSGEEEKGAKPDPNSPAGKLHRGAQQSNLKLIKEALSEGAYIDDKSPPCSLPPALLLLVRSRLMGVAAPSGR